MAFIYFPIGAFKMFYLTNAGGRWTKRNCHFENKEDNTFSFRINSYGEDEDGEVYIAVQEQVGAISPTGSIYKLGLKAQK